MKPLIFITNDDSVNAKGFAALIEMARPFGRIIALAPMSANSGMSHAITANTPLRLNIVKKETDLEIYSCNGTPADCVKLAASQLLNADDVNLLLSGINHGTNSSASVIYSGTLAATSEGLMYNIPSIGFSLCDYDADADFSACITLGRQVIEKAMQNGIDKNIYLSVNVPKLKYDEIKGIKACRTAGGAWRQEFEKRTDPHGHNYFWLTGYFVNNEPNATDTDEYWLQQGYATITPLQLDSTCHEKIQQIGNWF